MPVSPFNSVRRRHTILIAKILLCALCWVGLSAVLLAYGPPALSVSGKPTHVFEIVAAGFSIVLSTGTAAILTIPLVVGVLAASAWIRRIAHPQQNGTGTVQNEPDS